jgi:hypothetical protein
VKFRHGRGPRLEMVAAGLFLGPRRSCGGGLQGLGHSVAAWPRRSSGSAPVARRGVLGFGAALAWGMGFLGVAGWFKEGAGDLGVRAQEGNRRDSRAGITTGRCAAGRGGEDEPGSWARFVSGAPGALG